MSPISIVILIVLIVLFAIMYYIFRAKVKSDIVAEKGDEIKAKEDISGEDVNLSTNVVAIGSASVEMEAETKLEVVESSIELEVTKTTENLIDKNTLEITLNINNSKLPQASIHNLHDTEQQVTTSVNDTPYELEVIEHPLISLSSPNAYYFGLQTGDLTIIDSKGAVICDDFKIKGVFTGNDLERKIWEVISKGVFVYYDKHETFFDDLYEVISRLNSFFEPIASIQVCAVHKHYKNWASERISYYPSLRAALIEHNLLAIDKRINEGQLYCHYMKVLIEFIHDNQFGMMIVGEGIDIELSLKKTINTNLKLIADDAIVNMVNDSLLLCGGKEIGTISFDDAYKLLEQGLLMCIATRNSRRYIRAIKVNEKSIQEAIRIQFSTVNKGSPDVIRKVKTAFMHGFPLTTRQVTFNLTCEFRVSVLSVGDEIKLHHTDLEHYFHSNHFRTTFSSAESKIAATSTSNSKNLLKAVWFACRQPHLFTVKNIEESHYGDKLKITMKILPNNSD